ncbi:MULTISPECIES: ATP-binding protein [Clostridium]|uniref:histidine kinase n=1 Tax=Clostridium beijerinckii TaxID=1520 RepID=A0A1S9N5W6_CLOBE|nr:MULTISPECIES: ATP-binding protein [Clostridium]EKQ57742.1 MAG: transcriptional activator of acetoin/glycerol metabolism [Clostridium sp. Maddingley MBC34-26]MZK52606.1 GAF domain-containing protein [Clostridium beijerinckii]MZK60644.1 GAF domain-containing protein [Clostridium beijerinckii]MZK70919.1 GAF domain-containing protein [Clostridium beijerinckii]MZK76274.1 GAF domain-containing protein [Clostridium beijerinckii]
MKYLLNENGILKEWDNFISIINENAIARSITLESWKRCNDLGLERDKIKFKFLSDKDLKQKVQENSYLIEASKLYMDSLSTSLINIPHIVALADNEGWIIDLRGTPEEFGGKQAVICLGASWSEENIGNNGVGTAISIGEPILVYGREHYATAYGGCACIGAPIICNGNIIGAMDISVPVKYANLARLHILIACVNSIESTIMHINSNNSELVSINMNPLITSELIATTIHDLKNPLAVIRGLGQLGKLNSDKSKVDNYLNRIIKQVDEMNDMVIELLSIFKPEKLIAQKVASTLEEILFSFEPICESKKIKLCLHKNEDNYVNISEKLLKRAIENIINNAVQIMDEGGTIEILTEQDGDFIIISIRDTAGGIPEELSETLFEPFTFRRSGGTGLGLFMAYHTIVNVHKGQIWFETELKRGTTFFIKLPIAKDFESSRIEEYRLV